MVNDYIRIKAFYNSLMWLDDQGEPVHDLAESHELLNKQGTLWRFTLRKGVEFHDGSTLTPADVRYSFLRHKEQPSVARQLVESIKDVRIDGPNSIVFELSEPDVDFPLVVGTFHLSIVKDGTTDFLNPIGTGPFKVKEFRPGLRTSGVRHENYFKPGLPYLDGFELISILDLGARANALISGDVHMVTELRSTAIDQVKDSSSAQLLVSPSRRLSAMQYDTTRAPTDNHDLRLALNNLIDRKRYIDMVLKGYGTLGNDHPFMKGLPFYNDALPQRELDLDRAKHHFAKSGFGSQRLELNVTEAVPFSTEMIQLMQREASRIGLNIEIRRNPTDGYWSNVAGKRPATANTVVPRPTYGMNLNLSWKTTAAWNRSRLQHPKIDSLIDQGAAEIDKDKRAEIYGEVQRIIYESAAMTMPAFPNYIDGISKKVHGMSPLPVGPLGGYDFGNVAWLES
ncbi:ABC transporter substrate-binding protein [Paracandidimonas soli]|uniref:ABC transporter substrate-binding protein n=1 Tax=Paracandidimonas soli TaxID=1917182 RepID=UPI003340151F